MAYAIKTGINEQGENLYFQRYGQGCIQHVEFKSTIPQVFETLDDTNEQLKAAIAFFKLLSDRDDPEPVNYEIVEVEDQ